jgi:hypothetical protein
MIIPSDCSEVSVVSFRSVGTLGKTCALALITMLFITACSQAPNLLDDAPEVTVEPEENTPKLPQPEACSEATLGNLTVVITGQAQALSVSDFAGAYEFASPDFRARVPLNIFAQVIDPQYAMLLSFESASYGQCTSIEGSEALLSVIVESREFQPVAMLYHMVFVNGQWWVNAVDVPTSAVPNA